MKNGFTAVLTRMRPRGGISIAEIFGAGVSFIKKTLRSHRDGEGSSRRRRNGATPPLNEEQLAVLQAALEICPEATIEELQRIIADECKVRVSRKSIRHALKKLNPPLVKGD
jgi:transposase